MNENKMMSYEMYEELKSSIVKTIKTEIANAKLTNTMPNDLSQQIEQAVLKWACSMQDNIRRVHYDHH